MTSLSYLLTTLAHANFIQTTLSYTQYSLPTLIAAFFKVN